MKYIMNNLNKYNEQHDEINLWVELLNFLMYLSKIK